MGVTEALAVVGDCIVEEFNAEREARAIRGLSHWASRFSPIVSPDVQQSANNFTEHLLTSALYDGINLDITGCKRLFKGEHNLVQTILKALNSFGFFACVAVSPTLGCSWALSRYGKEARYGGQKHEIVPEHSTLDALTLLPINALRIPSETLASISEVGITSIGELLKLSPHALRSRFDTTLMTRINQALGWEEEVLEPIRAIAPRAFTKVFSGPTKQLRAIELTTYELLRQALAELQSQNKKIRALLLELTRTDAPPLKKKITLNFPSGNIQHLWSLLRPRIERFQLGFGVEAVSVTIKESEPMNACHSAFFGKAELTAENFQLGEFLDTLLHRLGANAVLYPEHAESHIPEKSFSYVTANGCVQHATQLENNEQVLLADRPSLLLETPLQINAISLLPDHPPYWIKWKNHAHRIRHGIGPERIAPEWWAARGSTRDYFKLQLLSGTWLWAFREMETNKWFVHGVWA